MSGRVALVTGSAAVDGLGFAAVRQLLSLPGLHSFSTVFVTGRSLDAARRAAAELDERARPLALDVTDAASIARAVSSVLEAVGRLDALVLNAGLGAPTGEDAQRRVAESGGMFLAADKTTASDGASVSASAALTRQSPRCSPSTSQRRSR